MRDGADLLMLEMMIDIDRMRATLDGAVTSGLPVWVGLTCGSEDEEPFSDDGTVRLRDGEPLEEAITALDAYDVGAITIMHTVVDMIDDCLDVALDGWPGIVAVYAHSGDYVDGKWIFQGVISPSEYEAHAQRWFDRGVRAIGGCCGIGPDHIQRLGSLGPDRRS